MTLKKKIFGFTSDNKADKDAAVNFLINHGFYKVSIKNKVEEFAQHLFTKKEILSDKEKIIENIRKRGLVVNKEYWVNLVLVSVPNNVDFIVFEDILPEEVRGNKIKVYNIVRSTNNLNNPSIFENITFDENVEDLYKKLQIIIKN